MCRVYHESLGFNWLKSWVYVFSMPYIAKRNIKMLDR